jgi:serine/threonine-protein kinase
MFQTWQPLDFDQPRPGGYHLVTRLRGNVYLARRPDAPREFAVLRAVPAELASSVDAAQILRDSAGLAEQVRHRHVLRTYQLVASDGALHLAAEYLAGQPLSKVISTLAQTAPRDTAALAAGILLQAAEGVHAVSAVLARHGHRDSHGDLSPASIHIGYDGSVKLEDPALGLAQRRLGAANFSRRLGYTAPEVARGGTADARSDVFALGAILWETLAGRRLFYATSDETMVEQILHGDIDSPARIRPGIPDPLVDICMQALARSPDLRFASPAELARALRKHAPRPRRAAGLLATHMKVVFVEELARETAFLRSLEPHGAPERAAQAVAAAPAAHRHASAPLPLPPPQPQRATGHGTAGQPDAGPRRRSAALVLLGATAVLAILFSGLLADGPRAPSAASLWLRALEAGSGGQRWARREPAEPEEEAAAAAAAAAPRPRERSATRPPAAPAPDAPAIATTGAGGVPAPTPGPEENPPVTAAPAPGGSAPAELTGAAALAGPAGSQSAAAATRTAATGEPGSATRAAEGGPAADSTSPGGAAVPPVAGREPAAAGQPAAAAREASALRAMPATAQRGAADATAPGRADTTTTPGRSEAAATGPSPGATRATAQQTARPATTRAARSAPRSDRPAGPQRTGIAARMQARQLYRDGIRAFVAGDSERAQSALTRAVDLDPGHAPSYRALAIVHERAGRTATARKLFGTYLQLAPEAEDGQQIRERMARLGGGAAP